MMVYLPEEKVKLSRQLSKEAISLALQGRWREAVAINKTILEVFPTDVDALNRLGRAYMELGEYAQAREAYHRALELDPYNRIAQKNLSRLEQLKETVPKREAPKKVAAPTFIEEMGKAGVVRLIELAPPEVIAKLGTGEEVFLEIRDKKLLAISRAGEYIGEVEPKHSLRLIRLMEGGNRYSAVVIGLDDEVKLLIKEVYQHPSQVGILSFPVKEEKVRPYIKETLVREEEYPEEEISIPFSYPEEEEFLLAPQQEEEEAL